jgi:RNA polymerase sigma factor (sigma-70 family)
MTEDACERGVRPLESEPDLETLYVRYRDFVRGALRKHYVDGRELEDMTQQVFIVLLRRVDEASEKRSIGAWLYQIARRVAANHHRVERRRGRKHEELAAAHEEPSTARAVGDPEEQYARNQAWRFVGEFLESLDDEACAVFVMSEIEGLRGVEIAARLRMTLPMTYARIRSVRARFDRRISRTRTGVLGGLWGTLERPTSSISTFAMGLAARPKLLLGVLFLAVVGLLAARGGGRGSAAPEPHTPLLERPDDDRGSWGTGGHDLDASRRKRGALGLFTGVVVDVDGTPIPGAIVCADRGEDHDHLLNDPPSCVTSDREGRFRIPHTLVRTHTLEAMARGFVPGRFRGQPSDELRLVLHPGGVELSGVVSDVHGGPIEGAWVSVENPSVSALGATATTDESGAFSLWVVEGAHSLAIGAEGYSATFEVALAPAKAVQIELSAESVIAGVVVDATTGAPQEGVRVEALLVPGPDRYANRGRVAFSDAEGRWEIRELQPNEYIIHAAGNRSWGRAHRAVDLGIGDRHDGIHIEMISGAGIVGRIVDANTGEGCADGLVVTLDPAQSVTRGGVTDPDGHVEIEGLAGGAMYEVTVDCRGYAMQRFEVDLRDGPVAAVEWPLDRGAQMEVRVVDGSDTPLPDWTVEVAVPLGAQHPALLPSRETTDAEGLARFSGLPSNTYRVVARGPGHPSIVAEHVEIRSERSELELRASTGVSVSGSVVGADGRPLAAALVALQPLESEPRRPWGEGSMRLELAPDGGIHHAVTDARGRFVHGSVGPGGYGVWVLPADAAVTVQRPRLVPNGFVTRIGGDPLQSVTVGVSELQLELRVGALQSIAGVVRDEDGDLVMDARVFAVREHDGRTLDPRGRPRLTDRHGRYRFDDLPAGTYALTAYRPGGGVARRGEVEAGAHDADLVFAQTGEVSGMVRGPDGAPLRGYTLAVVGGHVEERLVAGSADGRYVVGNLEAGRYTLRVRAPNGRGEVEVELAAGEHRAGFDITLEPLASVKGRLVDPEGNPLGGWIAGVRTPGTDATRPLEYVLIVKASGDGSFVLDGIHAKELAVVATPVQPELLDPPQGPDFFATVPELRVLLPTPGKTTDLGDVVVERSR